MWLKVVLHCIFIISKLPPSTLAVCASSPPCSQLTTMNHAAIIMTKKWSSAVWVSLDVLLNAESLSILKRNAMQQVQIIADLQQESMCSSSTLKMKTKTRRKNLQSSRVCVWGSIFSFDDGLCDKFCIPQSRHLVPCGRDRSSVRAPRQPVRLWGFPSIQKSMPARRSKTCTTSSWTRTTSSSDCIASCLLKQWLLTVALEEAFPVLE